MIIMMLLVMYLPFLVGACALVILGAIIYWIYLCYKDRSGGKKPYRTTRLIPQAGVVPVTVTSKKEKGGIGGSKCHVSYYTLDDGRKYRFNGSSMAYTWQKFDDQLQNWVNV